MKLEAVLARLLGTGTALACVLMTAGLVSGHRPIVVAGIATLIALPVVRVAVLLVAFARARDAGLAAAAAIVLAIIGLGISLAGRVTLPPTPDSQIRQYPPHAPVSLVGPLARRLQ